MEHNAGDAPQKQRTFPHLPSKAQTPSAGNRGPPNLTKDSHPSVNRREEKQRKRREEVSSRRWHVPETPWGPAVCQSRCRRRGLQATGPRAGSATRREASLLGIVFSWGCARRPTFWAGAELALCEEKRTRPATPARGRGGAGAGRTLSPDARRSAGGCGPRARASRLEAAPCPWCFSVDLGLILVFP